MKTALAQNSLWLRRTAKPSSEGINPREQSMKQPANLDTSEPDALALILSGM